MRLCHLAIVGLCLCALLRFGCSQGVGSKAQPNSYYFLRQNGGYEYAFNTDTGMQSVQRADHANEVTGHYMYYDKGVPFMVKYRAGVHGFQPEIIPAEKLLSGNYQATLPLPLPPPPPPPPPPPAPAPAAPPAAQPPFKAANYRPAQSQQLTAPKVSSFSIGPPDSPLKFVQDALQTMRSQPMHLSFNSALGHIQHPASEFLSTTQRPPIAAPLVQPVTRNEVRDINNLAALAPQRPLEPKHPYSFNYNGDSSSRSESADQAGNVIGSYSYYDEAGFHDVSYKAGDQTGFVILGRNSQNQQRQQRPQAARQFFRPNGLDPFNFGNFPEARLSSNSLDERTLGKRSTPAASNAGERYSSNHRSLRKFRRYSKW